MTRQRLINWAHRGASSTALENTLFAFQTAVQVGADGIECDLRESRDGYLMIFHDPTLKRLANLPLSIKQLTRADIAQIDIGSASGFRTARIPTLADLIAKIKPPTLLNLEIKQATPQKILATVYQYHAQDRVIISAFDYRCLIRIRALDSAIAIGYLVDDRVTASILKQAEHLRARALHLSKKWATPRVVEQVHRAGLQLSLYTVNDPDEMVRYINMGVDGLFTNDPERLAKLKGEHDSIS